MNRIVRTFIVLIALIAAPLTASCAWWNKNVQPDVNAAIDCAKAEANAAGGGHMASIVVDILSQFADAVIAKNVMPAIENLIAVYGEPVVACTLHEIANPPAAAGSGSGSMASPSTGDADPFTAAARDAITQRGWHFKS